mgnify:CR=1 FL=1
MDPQTVQTVSLVAIFAGFLLNEWRRGELRPPMAGREDDRLDIAILIMFPAVFAGVLATSTALCEWLLPQQRWLHRCDDICMAELVIPVRPKIREKLKIRVFHKKQIHSSG